MATTQREKVMPSDGKQGDEPIQELPDEAIEENPDDQTRRESFELDLMEEGRSQEGESIDLEEEAEHHDEN
jgi:hypothetical protein